jgi:cell division protein FtsN
MTQRVNQAPKGSTELARRIRAFHGLNAHIANVAGVTRSHITRVVAGTGISKRALRIALRELAKAESGRLEIGRAA